MSEKTGSKPAGSSQQTRKTKPMLYQEIARAISREGPQGIPPFPCKLHIVEHVRGEPIIYEELDEQVLQRRNKEFVAHQILQYAVRVAPKGRFPFDARDAINCMLFWNAYAIRLDGDILPVAQKSDIGFTFHRLPWDFVEGPCQTWDEIFTRVENADAIMAWIGSLFVPNSERQQYVWIYGEGGNGKGAINRFLKKVFNGAYKSEVVPVAGDKFWTSNLLNSRIVVFGDCNNYNFPTTGIFKQITGDDPIKVEFKGENAFSADLVCKLLFLSNKKPNITGQFSDVRRAIFSEIGPIKGGQLPTRTYDAILWEEGSAFLHKCVNKYKELCPENGYVPVNYEIVQHLVEDNQEYLEMLALKHFEMEPASMRENSELRQIDHWYVTPFRLHAIMTDMKFDEHKRKVFIDFLYQRFGVKKTRVRLSKRDNILENRYLLMKEASNSSANHVIGPKRNEEDEIPF